jgi:hypothetical protein
MDRTGNPLRRDPERQQLSLFLSRFRQDEIGAASETLRFYALHMTVADQ